MTSGFHKAEEQTLDKEMYDNGLQRSGRAFAMVDPPIHKPHASLRRTRRYLALIAVAVVTVILVAVLGTIIILNQTPSPKSLLSPSLWTWSQQGAYDSQTPQEALAANMHLTPCDGAPPQTATVTWLDAGRDYGFAFISVTCPHQPQPYATVYLALGRDDQLHWTVQAADTLGRRSGDSTSNSTSVSDVPVPAWLPLPSDTYRGDWVSWQRGSTPPASVAAWYSSSRTFRTFVFGHVADPATRPANATSVQVNRKAGWLTEENSVVIVTLPLADGSTSFFAGIGTASQVENLAATAFAHMDDVLPPLPR